jgi:hypothetical protein
MMRGLDAYPWTGIVVFAGLILLIPSILLLVECLILPIREKRHIDEKPKNGIYFHHLKGLKEDDIVRLFREDRLNQLAREVMRSNLVARQKEIRLKISTGLAVTGLALIVGTFYTGIVFVLGNPA